MGSELVVRLRGVAAATVAWWFALLLAPVATLTAHKGVWLRVEAVSGREAVLPCEVGAVDASFTSSDTVFVVLWYREGDKEPIYSFDNRPDRLLETPKDRHTVRSQVLKGRVTFRPGQVPALHIKPVLSTDQANYTCRVDFRIASSRRTHLTLLVVEPPIQAELWTGSRKVREGVLGNLQEDAELIIACTVEGGVPPPSVVWSKDGMLLDSVVESRQGPLTVNQLHLARLPRAQHGALLTCTATNNNVTSPVTASVKLTMNLRPIVTRLKDPPRSLRMGNEYHIVCVSAGSRPHPNITWTLGNLASLPSILARTEHGVNISSSVVRVTASRKHHGQRLSCTSVNPLFPTHTLSDSMLLNVTYPPVATLELTGSLTERGSATSAGAAVLEGEDVQFTCNIDANPPIYRISWFRYEQLLHHSSEAGVVIVEVSSMALFNVTRHQAGLYTCSASNVEGGGRSSPFSLTVNYAPVCEEGEAVRVYSAGVGQAVNITCSVLASPVLLKFSWVFNNTIWSERLSEDQVFYMPDGRSVAQFLVKEPRDYGSLQCWAQNSVGRMAQPCLFHITPAGRPESPLQCSVVNKSYDSLAVGCMPGFDGGLEQNFKVTVLEAVTGKVQATATSQWANFTLLGLTPGLDYLIVVAASNTLGDSVPVTLEAFTYKLAENRMRDEKASEVSGSEKQEEPALGESRVVVVLVVMVVVVTLVAVVVGAMVVRCVMVRRQNEYDHDRNVGRRIGLHQAPSTQSDHNLATGHPVRTPAGHTEVELELKDLMVGEDSMPLPPVPPRPLLEK